MKSLIYHLTLSLLIFSSGVLSAQNNVPERLNLPGDNLNLYAVIKLFQECKTLEEFEGKLNDSEQMINNLDLNNDGKVDYIMVMDYSEGNLHNIVLRVAMNAHEDQDVAVIIVEKQSDGSVIVQIIGDETLYGKDYIIEPNYAETPNPGYKGNTNYSSSSSGSTTTYYEVSEWPVVVHIYEPYYASWYSPWYWGFYPPYWHPWTPFFWHFYYGYHYHWWVYYNTYYRPWRYYRCHHGYFTVYYGRVRHHSPTVIVNINHNVYVNTYSKPEKFVDGEKFFAEKNPNGASGSLNSVSKEPKSLDESQNQKQIGQSVKGLDDGKPSEDIKKPLVRPVQTTVKDERNDSDNIGRESNSKPTQKEPIQTQVVSRPQEASKESSGDRISRPSSGAGKPSSSESQKPSSKPSGNSSSFGSKPSSSSDSKPSSSSSSKPSSSSSSKPSSSSSSKPSSSSSSKTSSSPSSSKSESGKSQGKSFDGTSKKR